MYQISKLEQKNIAAITAWCEGKDSDFLYLWGVDDYRWPLTEQQISDRLESGAKIFQATENGKIEATIELLQTNGKKGLAGKFLTNQTNPKKGRGSEVMEAFKHHCKEALGLSELEIYAFNYNKPALRCYEKCGFAPVSEEIRDNGKTAIKLKVTL